LWFFIVIGELMDELSEGEGRRSADDETHGKVLIALI